MATTVGPALSGEAMATLSATGSEDFAAGMGSLAGAIAEFAGATDLGRTKGGLHDEFGVKMIGKALDESGRALDCQGYKAAAWSLGIGDPKGRVWRDFNSFASGFVGFAAEEIAPVFGADEVEFVKGNGLGPVRDVIYGKNTLVAVAALPPEGEELVAEVKGELGGVGMEGNLLFSNSDPALEFVEYLVVVGFGIVELLHEGFEFPLVAVDSAGMTGLLMPIVIVFSGKEAVNVESGDTLEREEDRMSAKVTLGLEAVWSIGNGTTQCVKQADIHFVG